MLVAIEGIDGAGKATATQLIVDWFRESGHEVEHASFPRYDSDLGAKIKESLTSLGATDPNETVRRSLLFAMDRYAFCRSAAPGHIWIVDRWVASNAAYACALAPDTDADKWISDLEFGRLGLPQPRLTILIQSNRALQRERLIRRTTLEPERTGDRLEADEMLQARVSSEYDRLALSSFGGKWETVFNNGALLDLREQLHRVLSSRFPDGTCPSFSP